VARQRPDGMLDSPNPAPNYPREGAIGDVLARDEFDRYGPSSAVWINAEAHAAPPDHPQPSLPTREEIDAIRADIDSQLAEIRARLPA
jgi:hypothetical protein